MFVSAGSAAGGYAERRYKRGLRSWRSKTRKPATLIFGPFILLGAAGGVAAGHGWSWLAGALFGIGAGAWVAVRESPPAYIENWQTGAEGERKTARVLRGLDTTGWTLLNDIQTARGNYDHVLVGPAGVFLLDSKNPIADAYTRDGALWLRRRHDPEADRPVPAVRAAALRSAADLHDKLKQRAGRCPWVRAVSVLWCPFKDGTCETSRHTLIHGEKLRAWLEAQPETLSAAQTRELAAAARRLAQAADG